MSTYQKYADIYKNRQMQKKSKERLQQNLPRSNSRGRMAGSSSQPVNGDGTASSRGEQSRLENTSGSMSPLRQSYGADSKSILKYGRLAQRSSSPVEQRLRQVQSDVPPRPDLGDAHDQNAYMTFLEIQLERISLTCLQQQKSNEIIKDLK